MRLLGGLSSGEVLTKDLDPENEAGDRLMALRAEMH